MERKHVSDVVYSLKKAYLEISILGLDRLSRCTLCWGTSGMIHMLMGRRLDANREQVHSSSWWSLWSALWVHTKLSLLSYLGEEGVAVHPRCNLLKSPHTTPLIYWHKAIWVEDCATALDLKRVRSPPAKCQRRWKAAWKSDSPPFKKKRGGGDSSMVSH